jgi:hypothetical protein
VREWRLSCGMCRPEWRYHRSQGASSHLCASTRIWACASLRRPAWARDMRQWRLSRGMCRTEWRCRRAQGILNQTTFICRICLHIRTLQTLLIPCKQPLSVSPEAICSLQETTLPLHRLVLRGGGLSHGDHDRIGSEAKHQAPPFSE